MKVSFDLDDTLFVSPDEFETEAVPSFTYKWKYKERIRKGTIELFEKLRAMDVEIWIYTTSFWSERYKVYIVNIDMEDVYTVLFF